MPKINHKRTKKVTRAIANWLLLAGAILFLTTSLNAQFSGTYLSDSSPHFLDTEEQARVYTNLSTPPNFLLLAEESPESQNFGWDWKDLFEEPDFFEKNSYSILLGVGFRSTVDLDQRSAELNQVDVKTMVPAVHLIVERQVWNNIGAGLSLGTQIWSVPILDYQYRYYTGGLRATYHFNVLDKLDPYVGMGATYRRMELTNNDRNVVESKFTGHFILGVRYYLTNTIGAYLEMGDDTTSWFKFGVSFYLNKIKKDQ